MKRPLPVEILEFYGCTHCHSLFVIRKGTRERFRNSHEARCQTSCAHGQKSGQAPNVAVLGEVQNQ